MVPTSPTISRFFLAAGPHNFLLSTQMSTLTLAVNDYFKSDLAPAPDLDMAPDFVSEMAPESVVSAPATPLGGLVAKPLTVPAHIYAGAFKLSKSASDLSFTGKDVAPRLWPDSLAKSGIPVETMISKAGPEINLQNKNGARREQKESKIELFAAPAPSIVLSGTSTPRPRAGSETPIKKLKSSLKLPSLTKLYSTLNLSPKLVRFASRLEKVKMFDGRDSPFTVSLQNTPVGSPTHDFDLHDYFSSHRNFNDLDLDRDSDLDSDSDDSDTFREYTKDRLYKISSSNFSPPKNIYDRQHSPVYLQLMALAADKKLLVLLVMCQNLAYEKALSVKLSFNNWQSNLIFTNPTYMKSFTSVNFDQFKFTIPLAHLPSAVNAQFCIKYDVNGASHWDNNSSRNYNVVLSSSVPQKNNNFAAVDSFTYKTPTFLFAAKPASSHTPSVSLEKKVASPYNYDELISKLILVSKSDMSKPSGLSQPSGLSKPSGLSSALSGSSTALDSSKSPLHSSASLPSLKPRYSQSFRAKNGESALELPGRAVGAVSGAASAPAVPKKVKPVASFQDSKFNSTSYATLLQTYCFNGASSSAESSAVGSLANLRSNSSTSVNSDFMSAMPTAIPTSFNSYSDSSIYI